jgi:hypothetical protein
MTEMTPRLALPLLQSGQAQKEVFHNEALTLLDLAVQAAVKAVGIDTPPDDVNLGECWIVGTNPTGGWMGHAGEIAGWTGGGWRFVTPRDGTLAWSTTEMLWVQHIGDTWVRGRIPGESLWIGGKQVVGSRQGAIAPPAGGAVADGEARAAISAILAALQAHGLIGA